MSAVGHEIAAFGILNRKAECGCRAWRDRVRVCDKCVRLGAAHTGGNFREFAGNDPALVWGLRRDAFDKHGIRETGRAVGGFRFDQNDREFLDVGETRRKFPAGGQG